MLTFILIIILLGADQLSKYFITLYLAGKEPLSIIPGYLEFYYLENRGAAFGILQEKRILFIIITVIVVGFIFYALTHYNKNSSLFYISLVLILSGTLGNFIDRVRLHYVVDFIKIRIFGYNFAIFNLADTFIVIGTILLMIYILLNDKKGTSTF